VKYVYKHLVYLKKTKEHALLQLLVKRNRIQTFANSSINPLDSWWMTFHTHRYLSCYPAYS